MNFICGSAAVAIFRGQTLMSLVRIVHLLVFYVPTRDQRLKVFPMKIYSCELPSMSIHWHLNSKAFPFRCGKFRFDRISGAHIMIMENMLCQQPEQNRNSAAIRIQVNEMCLRNSLL